MKLKPRSDECLIVFNGGVAKRLQHFVQHDTTFLQIYLPESILKNCKAVQPNAKIARIQLTKFAKKISLGLVNKGMWCENCFYCARASITEHNRIAWSGQMRTTSYSILENKRDVVSYNICILKKFDRDQTSYRKIQHDTIRYDTTRWPNECNISYNIKVVCCCMKCCTRLAGALSYCSFVSHNNSSSLVTLKSGKV